MKPNRALVLPSIPFMILTPIVGILVCAPALGLWFPEWPAVSLEGLGVLALVGAFGAQAEQSY